MHPLRHFPLDAHGLPTTMTGWRQLLVLAADLPATDVRVPPAFLLTHSSGVAVPPRAAWGIAALLRGAFTPRWIANPRLLFSKSPSGSTASPQKRTRQSAVMVLLAPQLRVHEHDMVSSPMAFCADPTNYGPGSETGQVEGSTKDGDVVVHDLVFPVTKRQGKMRAHAGQMSFPGGRCDPGETPEEAAVREVWEEIGVAGPGIKSTGNEVPSTTSQTSPGDHTPAYEVVATLRNKLYSSPSKSFVHVVLGLQTPLRVPASSTTEESSNRERERDLGQARGDGVGKKTGCIPPLDCHVASPDEVDSIHLVSLRDLLLDPTRCVRHEERWSKSSGSWHLPSFRTNSVHFEPEEPASTDPTHHPNSAAAKTQQMKEPSKSKEELSTEDLALKSSSPDAAKQETWKKAKDHPTEQIWGLTAFALADLLARIHTVLPARPLDALPPPPEMGALGRVTNALCVVLPMLWKRRRITAAAVAVSVSALWALW